MDLLLPNVRSMEGGEEQVVAQASVQGTRIAFLFLTSCLELKLAERLTYSFLARESWCGPSR